MLLFHKFFKFTSNRVYKSFHECQTANKKCERLECSNQCKRCAHFGKNCVYLLKNKGHIEDNDTNRNAVEQAEMSNSCCLSTESKTDAYVSTIPSISIQKKFSPTQAEMSNNCRSLTASKTNAFSCVQDFSRKKDKFHMNTNQLSIPKTPVPDSPLHFASSASSVSDEDSEWLMSDDETEDQHHIQHGLDLTENGEVGMTSDFLDAVTLKTNCHGSQLLFFVEETSFLTSQRIQKRISMRINEYVVFIESTQLCNFPQACAGNVCVFATKRDKKWSLGIIQNLFPLDDVPFLRVFCWNGMVSSKGVSMFAVSPRECWEDIESHFLLKTLMLKDIELKFVNQVAGPSICLEPISSSTTNSKDGSVQCSSKGPDIFLHKSHLHGTRGIVDLFR